MPLNTVLLITEQTKINYKTVKNKINKLRSRNSCVVKPNKPGEFLKLLKLIIGTVIRKEYVDDIKYNYYNETKRKLITILP